MEELVATIDEVVLADGVAGLVRNPTVTQIDY
jgi:hypothetical protein